MEVRIRHGHRTRQPVTISRNGDGGDDMNNLAKNPKLVDVYQRVALRLGAVFLISASQVAGAQASPRVVTDADVLPVILKAALSDGTRRDLRVDPRPMIPDASYQYAIQPEVFAPVSQGVIDKRTAIVRAAGLVVVDTTVVNQSRNCPGILVVPDSLQSVDNKRALGCPENPFDVLTVGPPRPGNASIPTDQVYDRSRETAACGYWAVRVIRTTFGHGRSTAYAADYLLTERGGQWIVVKTVGLMNSE